MLVMSNYSLPRVDSFTSGLSPPSLPYLVALFAINLPIIAIVLNVLQQLASLLLSYPQGVNLMYVFADCTTGSHSASCCFSLVTGDRFCD